jgi:hypothetical protein
MDSVERRAKAMELALEFAKAIDCFLRGEEVVLGPPEPADGSVEPIETPFHKSAKPAETWREPLRRHYYPHGNS